MNKKILDEISSEIKNELTTNQIKRIQYIDEEDYSGVTNKAKKELNDKGVFIDDNYCKNAIFALKQYYTIALLDPLNAHAISLSVDPFWHAHILHTEQYAIFCTNVVGDYMHHRPLNLDVKKQVNNVCILYKYTLEILSKIFDHIDETFWKCDFSKSEVICFHKGNRDDDLYAQVLDDAIFKKTQRGSAYAFETII